MTSPSRPTLETPLSELFGVGPERAAQLRRLKLETVRDLLHHAPRRHEDRRHVLAIRDLKLEEECTARGAVSAMGVKTFARQTRSVFELVLDDGTARLHCRWWNLPFMQKYFRVGDEVFVYGKVNSLRPRMIDHPESEVIDGGEETSIHLNRIAPIYPLTEGLPQRWMRSRIFHLLQSADMSAISPFDGGALKDFQDYAAALRQLHFPAEFADAEAGRRRLAMEELLRTQIAMRERRNRLLAKAKSVPCGGDNHLIKPFLASLHFRLTTGQADVLREIRRDMAAGIPMRRLLQGDVGAGKTVVAACSALMALESGCNAALMAPTEILASQHHQNFRRWFEPLGIGVGLRTGNVKADRNMDARGTQGGRLVIGTHALIESGFDIERLGLVIIDEQHKFGVTQREKLLRKGSYPHLLVMTATPIPRTLGLTVYGDLDISVIRELPGGRKPIRTFVREAPQLPKVWKFIQEKLTEGRQAFVVYPRLEEDEGGTIKAVTSEWEKLKVSLKPWNVGMIHGRMRPEDKEKVMTEFRANRVHVLMATSVIEVGVDVPNATIMVIENAEQFGLAQLHQLRGRIGRGQHESYCILVAGVRKPDAIERLEVMTSTTDGFQIAEADLQMRGPGDFLGQDQSGAAPFKFARLTKDLQLVERARELAIGLAAKG